ncbi:Rid family detoxifying hydrolase [Sphaerisporangium sp. NPDC051011]|uniref:RidA family protein n=1 Tax=Sphaerisporangium sp. NPDC051011 TaxID=3155792 RepID=UPI0033EB22A6
MNSSASRVDVVSTAAAPEPAGAYSQGIVVGDFLFTSGIFGLDPETGRLPESVEDQTRQTLLNIEAVLAARGLSLADVVKATVHLQDVNGDFDAFNRVYESMFEAPYPVRTTVGSDLRNLLVEIDVVARLR